MADPTELSVADFFRFGREAATHTAELMSQHPAYAAAARDDRDERPAPSDIDHR